MRNTIGFSLSPLEAFEKTGKPFIVYKGRIYTVEKPTEKGTRNNLFLGKDHYEVFPADTLFDLRNEQFAKHQDKLKDYMNWVLSFKVIRRIKDLEGKLDKNIDYYGQLQRDKINKLMIDVFDQYNHHREKPPEENGTTRENPEVLLELDELYSLHDPFDQCMKKPGMIAFGGYAHALEEQPRKKKYVDSDYRLFLTNKSFMFNPTTPLRDVIIEYDARIKGLIEKTALEQGKQFANKLSLMKDREASLTSLVQRHQDIITNKKDKNISYRRVKGDRYRITVNIPPFLFERNGEYYAFSTQKMNGSKHVMLGLDLIITNNTLQFKEAPSVLTKPYLHPFVFESGDLCYKGNVSDPWKEKGIKFSQDYPLESPGLARKVMLALKEGERSITHGLLGTHANPVHKYDDFTPVAHSREEALHYARSHGISEKRIFRNTQ